MIASNFWVCPTKPGEVGCRFFATLWIRLRKQGGEVATIPINTGEGVSTILTALQMSPGVLMSTSILITCRGVLLIHAPPDATSATTYFVTGIKSFCDTKNISLIPWSIPGFIARCKTWMVRLLNNFVQNFCCWCE